MEQSLKQLYTIMLMYCGWVERHEILLNSEGWIEEHCIQTMDAKHRGFEIRFMINMIDGYVEVVGVTMSNPRVDNYAFPMDHMRRLI